MIDFLIYFLVLCIVLGLVWWIITQLPLPEPFGRIARVVFIVVAVILLIYLLLGLVGTAPRLGRL